MLSIAIVGLGRIGSGYDMSSVGGIPRSHVGAALASGNFDIQWLVDVDPVARERACQRWPQLSASRLADRIQEITTGSVDVIALCTPSEGRAEEIAVALTRAPRALIVEKPFCRDVTIATGLAQSLANAGIETCVTFQRRFDPGHVRLKSLLPGIPRKVVFRYSKGIFNYGSHAVDLLMNWFGPIKMVQALDQATGADPSLSFRCSMAAEFDAYFIGLDGLGYDQFEADIFFDDCRFELANGGVERRIYRGKADKYYPGYRQLDIAAEDTEIALVGGLAELYVALARHMELGKPFTGCTAFEAVAGLMVVETALRSREQGGRTLSVPSLRLEAS